MLLFFVKLLILVILLERKAVIVGSGPSLDDNLEYLSAAQDNAYYLCMQFSKDSFGEWDCS